MKIYKLYFLIIIKLKLEKLFEKHFVIIDTITIFISFLIYT